MIRELRPGDLPRLCKIDSVCFERGIAYTRAEMTFFVRQKGSVVRIAEKEGEILAFAVGALAEERCGHVITIDVLPEARRQGIGAALLSTLHTEFGRAGADMSILEVDVDNRTAQAFYLGFGYRRTAILTDYYGPGRNAYQMLCRLSLP